jgi:hypothetical protein
MSSPLDPSPRPRASTLQLSRETQWLLTVLPPTVLYTALLYLAVLLFLGVSYLAVLQVSLWKD